MKSEELWAFSMISKLCHDLATPLSSLGMALELKSPHEDLMAPLQQANFYLKVWRFLSSKVTPDATLNLHSFLKIFNEYLEKEKKWSLTFSLSDMEDFDPTTAKLHAIMLILATQLLPLGGSITVEEPFVLQATGPKCFAHSDILEVLQDLKTIETVGSRGVLVLYAQEFLLKPFGLCFDLQLFPSRLVLSVEETKKNSYQRA